MDGRPEMVNIALEFFLQAQVEAAVKEWSFLSDQERGLAGRRMRKACEVNSR